MRGQEGLLGGWRTPWDQWDKLKLNDLRDKRVSKFTLSALPNLNEDHEALTKGILEPGDC